MFLVSYMSSWLTGKMDHVKMRKKNSTQLRVFLPQFQAIHGMPLENSADPAVFFFTYEVPYSLIKVMSVAPIRDVND